jgi:RimJ/RimL family protein N-acetyltransferase
MGTNLSAHSETITIRPVTEEDVAAYRDLRLEALREHPEAFGADYQTNLAEPMDYWIERVRKNVGGDTGIIYLALDSGSLVGMTGIFRGTSPKNIHSGMIWGVFVRPGWRGRGIAGRLIQACLSWGQEQGVRIAKLAVVTTNASAIRCYVGCGFSVYGVEPEAIYYGGVYYDELLMARRC